MGILTVLLSLNVFTIIGYNKVLIDDSFEKIHYDQEFSIYTSIVSLFN